MVDLFLYVISGVFGGMLFGGTLGYTNGHIEWAADLPFMIIGALGGFFGGFMTKNRLFALLGGLALCVIAHFLFRDFLVQFFRYNYY